MIADVKSDKSPDLAIIDIGSNAVRLIFYTDKVKGQVRREMCALGRDLQKTGKLWPEGVQHAVQALKSFKAEIDTFKNIRVAAIATAAVRAAEDGPAFVKTVRDETGIDIRVLRGTEEAEYAARGVMAGGHGADALIGDFGGGSLELVRTRDGQVSHQLSLPLGSRVLEAGTDPNEFLAQLDLRDMAADQLVAIGGSWRALAEAHMAHGHGKRDLHGYKISAQDLSDFSDWLNAQGRDVLETLLDESRRGSEGIRKGALVLQALIQQLGVQTVVFSKTGMRDGLVAEL